MATSKRVLMTLRSGLKLEAIWAINVLNVILYDDTTPMPFSLSSVPELLNILVEYLVAVLSVLFPNRFKVVRLRISF